MNANCRRLAPRLEVKNCRKPNALLASMKHRPQWTVTEVRAEGRAERE
jgi:hypothetical protein